MAWRNDDRWAPYVPVAQRRRKAEAMAKALARKGQALLPVNISGHAIATTFWGKNWCQHLERFSDFANRLPRGRTYARNGSIVDLQITSGEITAMVSGSKLYNIRMKITSLEKPRWKSVCQDCSESIHSLIDLMSGKLGNRVIERLTDKKRGVFPEPHEIKMSCTCPDYAGLCKHLAAVLYGVGHRLDTSPELLFLLRGVDQADLVAASLSSESLDIATGGGQSSGLASDDLSELFGIDLAPLSNDAAAVIERKPKKRIAKKTTPLVPTSTQRAEKKAAKRSVTKKAAKKESVKKTTTTTTKKKVTKKAATKKFSVAAEIAKNFKRPAVVKKKTRKKAARKKAT